jgi:hypothetical protein
MGTKNYLKLCLAISIVVAMTVLFVPGVSDRIETEMLTFLSTNAR